MNSEYKSLTEKAYALHTNNNFSEAEVIYEKLLKIRPDDVNILNLYGLLSVSLMNYPKAIKLLSKALVLKQSSYVASNLGKAYYLNDEYDKSIIIYKQALEYKEDDDTYYSLGLAYKKIGDTNNAILCYKKAIDLNPNKYSALYNLANTYKMIGNIDNAISYSEMAMQINSSDEELHVLLASCYEEKHLYKLSIEEFEKAILLNSNNNLYFYNAAVLYSKISNTEKAIEYYNKSIELDENYVEAYVNLSTLLREKDMNLALEVLEKAYKIAPQEKNVCLSYAKLCKDMNNNDKSISILNVFIKDNPEEPEAYSILAANYIDLCEYNRAKELYNKALIISPDNLNYMHGYAISLKYLGFNDEAKKILRKILSIDNNQTQTSITLGMMYLTEKNFYEGMKLYTKRSKETKITKLYTEKIWKNGDSLENKNVLVYSDCGLGDTIMYSRYLNALKAISSNVTLKTDREVVSVLKRNFPDINIIRKTEPAGYYDIVISIMDLGYALNSGFDNIPLSGGYIKPDKELSDKYSNLDIFKTNKKKAGLFWHGNKRIFKNREIKFNELNSILELSNIQYYSFMLDDVQENEHIINLDKYIKSYDDTSALLTNMDLLICIDSSIVHMAGAMGVKTYLLLPKTPEWRWFNDENNTPWYDSVKIFKQIESGQWNEPISRIKNELLNL